jgi:hypothetical protein
MMKEKNSEIPLKVLLQKFFRAFHVEAHLKEIVNGSYIMILEQHLERAFLL